MKNLKLKKWMPYIIGIPVAIAIFLFISVTYFSPVFDGKQLNQSDVIHYKGSSKEISDYRNKTGEEALWTNSMFGGMPAYQISVLYKTSIVPFFKKIVMGGFILQDINLYFFLLGLFIIILLLKVRKWILISTAISLSVYTLYIAIYFLIFKTFPVFDLPFPINILFVLFLGFFILLLTLKTNPWLSIVGAIAFAFSSYFFIYLSVGHNSQTLAIAFIPLVLSGILLTFKGKYWLGGALTALFMAIEINVNHVQMTYYMLLIIGFIVLFEFIYAIIDKKLKSFFIAVAVLIFAGIVSIGPNVTNLWTSSEYVKETIRGKSELTDNGKNRSNGLDKDYIMQWSYGIGETFTLMIPDAKGGESEAIGKTKSALENVDRQYREPVAQQSRYWGNLPFTSGPVYVGAFIAFLFILGLFIVKGRLKWALFAVTILAMMLSWGHNFRFLTDFFIDYIPYYNKFRAVSSILIIAEVTMPLLGILALKEIVENPSIVKTKKVFFFISLGLTAGLTLLFLLMPGLFFNFTTPEEVNQFNAYLKQGANKSQIDAILSNLEIARMSIFKMSCIRTIAIIVIGAGLIWTYASVKKMSKYVLYAALGILILIDMVPIDKRYLNDKSFVPKKQMEVPYTASAADEFILQDTTSSFRVLNMTTGNFTLDASTSYFHKSLGGYHAAKLRRYQDLVDRRIGKEQERLINTLKAGAPDSVLIATMYGLTTMNMLNTKYYIYNPEARPLKNHAALGNAWFVKNVTMVDNADAEIKALDNFSPATTAIVDKKFETELSSFKGDKDFQSTIKLVDYKPNYLVYETKNLKANQLAVFSEIYYDKGWDAYIDGNKAPYFRANYVLRAMVIPAGDHKIEFKFEPQSYYVGEKVSLAGSVLLVLFLAVALFFEFRKKKEKVIDTEAKANKK